ncbi:ABC transporter ATP-binding protein [Actinomadura gamaensis]|uniref:ABC transporter ATP-binding protein n=1 Tax=Actinomadura gamaensis TaxID=1763541 RepID=A0ABV9TUV5_9ACTN
MVRGRTSPAPAAAGPPDGPAPCAATGLTRRFPGASRPAVRDVSVTVRPGEIFGVLGRNGAGKTTLIRMLVGLCRPDSGRVLLRGREITGNAALGASGLAYLPQRESALADTTVRTAVETTARLRGLPRRDARAACDGVLAELGITGLAGRRVARLSGGQRRIAGVAAALAGSGPLLVLDEPTTGLDLDARRAVWSALARRRDAGSSVVLVTHNVLEAETVLDRVLVLHAGRAVATGTPGELKARFDGRVRLDLRWRGRPPLDPGDLDGEVAADGRRWSVRLPLGRARRLLDVLLAGPAFAELDDFALAPPSLEDVLLACDAGPPPPDDPAPSDADAGDREAVR